MSKEIYQSVGAHFQVEGDFVHVDVGSLSSETGVAVRKQLMTREEAVETFNHIVSGQGAKPLISPFGYMALDDNVHAMISEIYIEKYEDTLDNIAADFAMGTTHALQAVLDDLPKKISHDMRKHMPDHVKYSDLKFVGVTPEIENAVSDFVNERVRLTQVMSIRRSVEESTIQRINENLDKTGARIGEVVAEIWDRRNSELGSKLFASSLGELGRDELEK